jgi:hypothetical protein
MAKASQRHCRMDGCENGVVPILAADFLCLDHFLEQSSDRALQALDRCQRALPLDSKTVDWLLSDAQHAAVALAIRPDQHGPDDQDRILDLLLCLTNLQEYIRHHSVQYIEKASSPTSQKEAD